MSNQSESKEEEIKIKGWRKVIKNVGDWMRYKDKEEWLKDMRGNLTLVASIIATMTFQSAISPPGGVFQADPKANFTDIFNESKNLTLRHGEAVLAVVYPQPYKGFLVSNTICFIAALCVCLLLVSGFPLNKRFPIWLLSVGMCITVISLSLTYLFAAAMVTPANIWGSETVLSTFGIVILVWTAIMGIVGFFLVIRLFFWIVGKWKGKRSRHNRERI